MGREFNSGDEGEINLVVRDAHGDVITKIPVEDVLISLESEIDN